MKYAFIIEYRLHCSIINFPETYFHKYENIRITSNLFKQGRIFVYVFLYAGAHCGKSHCKTSKMYY